MKPSRVRNLGWWAISGECLMRMLQRVQDGELAEIVYIEEYAAIKAENLARGDE